MAPVSPKPRTLHSPPRLSTGPCEQILLLILNQLSLLSRMYYAAISGPLLIKMMFLRKRCSFVSGSRAELKELHFYRSLKVGRDHAAAFTAEDRITPPTWLRDLSDRETASKDERAITYFDAGQHYVFAPSDRTLLQEHRPLYYCPKNQLFGHSLML